MKRLLRLVCDFFISQRASGTTTLLKSVAANNDVWVLVPNAEMKSEFGSQGVSFDDLERMQGKAKKPILVDNYTMLKLCDDFNINITELEQLVKDRDVLINSIDHLIHEFQRNKPQSYLAIDHSNGRNKITYFHNEKSKFI
ncbi:MAG: hypothetical protein EBU01_10225 [Crocinitomicaceae bacterium]|nr:hypothetical protein [Crocinitomicaceae bacterium]